MGKVTANRIPRWKKWLSYLFEFHIESSSSAFNPHLYVLLSRGRFQLCSANAVYSFGDRYDNFRKAFRAIDLETAQFRDVLVLGLGLGSIPYLLEKTFGQKMHFTTVEIDEAVVELAYRYALQGLESPVECIVADASRYVPMPGPLFDLICMDIFLDDTVPEAFTDTAFLEQLAGRLQPEGLLLFNRLAVTRKDRAEAEAYFTNVFRTVFPEAYCLDVETNFILFSHPRFLRESAK